MSPYDYLVVESEIPDISYRTEKREEVIYPRVTEQLGVFYVYCNKETVTLEEFIRRLSNNEEGLWIAGYRKASGKPVQSTITFSKKERVKISPRLQKLMSDIGTATSGPTIKPKPVEASPPNSDVSAAGSAKSLSLEELEQKLKRQTEIGQLGELAAYRHESLRLSNLGCANPNDQIDHVSPKNVSAGYDLRSEFSGEIRFIEVKSSVSRTDNFFLSENERKQLTSLAGDAYIYLVRVDEDDEKKSCVIREMRDPFAQSDLLTLEPTAWFLKIK